MAEYTLLHNPFSICSLMVRYAIAVRGEPKDESSAMFITEQVVDLFHSEQLKEEYLCEVNPKGQVPVLSSPSLTKAVADSLEITRFIAERYPQLVPQSHSQEVLELLNELHEINYFSISFAGKTSFVKDSIAKIRAILADRAISERYRKALEYKIEVTEVEKLVPLDPETTEQNEQRAKALLERFSDLLSPAKGPWLWGLQDPTAVDTHLVIFLLRLEDTGHEAWIPAPLKEYTERAMKTDELQGVMQGRRTAPPGGMPGKGK